MTSSRGPASTRGLVRAGLVGLALAATLAACSPRVDNRGMRFDPDVVAEVRPGMSTRDDVLYILGTPSTISSFQGPVWYYIGQRTEKMAFFDPEVTERQVVEVLFDETDRVSQVNLFGLEDGQEVELVERETPTEGQDITIVQQLLGNLGRFNTD